MRLGSCEGVASGVIGRIVMGLNGNGRGVEWDGETS